MHIDWLAKRADLSPQRIALIDSLHGCRTITFADWNRAANRTAWLLRERCGLTKGDRVAILAMNCVEYLDLWFACQKLGAILQHLNWRLSVQELTGLVADATPRLLVYGADFLAQADQLRHLAGGLEECLALEERRPSGADDLCLADREDFPASSPPLVELDLDDPWSLCYTGGTTGLPKGAVLTQGNILWNAVNTLTSWELKAEDITLLNAPLFHTGGLNVLTAPLVLSGGTSILCRNFDPDQVFDLMQNFGVTLWFGVPTMFIMMQQHPRWPEADLSRLRFVISGGAPCPEPVFERFWAKGVEFKSGYGLTEAGPNTFWLPREDVRRKPGSVGKPLFQVEVRVRLEDREAGPGEVGELYIRGPHVCRGYWNRPLETAQAIQDGWLRTGDLARYDEEGYYSIVGRRKDMIISGGENIYPAEVESVLASHPGVAEAVLIGVPDDIWGEVGRAVVVAVPGYEAGAEELLSFCGTRLARYKIPRSLVFAPSIPRTAAHKVDKTALQRLYGAPRFSTE